MLRAAACAVAAVATAHAATISAQSDIPSWRQKSAMQLALSSAAGDVVPLTFIVMPSTESLGLNQTDVVRGSIKIEGAIIAANSANYNSINQPTQVAYLSCDSPEDSGFIDPNLMLNTLMENRPKAIVLYSTVGNWCSLSGDLNYQTIFTMADAGDAGQALHILNGTNEVDVIKVTITGNATADSANGANGGGGNNSAVAMSILYSITGLITFLFLIIIITGAVRAHRYPERYGPRSGFNGRPRQSRAKGLARAVLDTLPIVKFGERQESLQKPDPNIELESASTAPNERDVESRSEARQQETVPVNAKGTGSTTPTVTTAAAIPVAAGAAARDETTASKAPANAVATGAGNAEAEREDEENLGCSICTDDFSVGEDVRVLPCNHKFHPNCVDPWLVNVSGTCPLCRLDLRPQGDTEPNEEFPPPLDLDGHESDGSSTAQRRRSRLLDLNRLRHASAEERIQALRQYRTQQQGQAATDDVPGADRDERSRRAKLADKLRDKFRIRTGPQS
ncbi:Receptor-like proteiny region, transmembrane domain- and RING domain-containing protein 2 [Colletotrichum spinosum]|uniref:RING-type E3 ubiquitin transferase n=1 Tax=Colletotrichum spinosum TaxID=1347390 RepID=A0A4R8Q7X2_9PEZI|nr:Receptor-like proteiny region, transmembrane domain- and RING domain-containing protein 2 [Colletotrichum spinosum]